MKAFRLGTYAKKLGYKNARAKGFQEHIRRLEHEGKIKVQQSGFRSHSCHHPKIIILGHDDTKTPKKRCRKTTSNLDRVRLISSIWCDYCKNYHDVTELKERDVGKRVNYYCPLDKQEHPYILASLEHKRLD